MISKRVSYNILSFIVVCFIAVLLYLYIPQKQIESQQYNIADSTKHEVVISEPNNLQNQKKINPNTATFEELYAAGFTKKQAKNCLNYIQAGNKFMHIGDIKKLYTIQDSDFIRIAKNLYIPQKKDFTKQQTHSIVDKNIEKQKLIVHLNTCDTVELQKIPGIGNFRARKIIEYRNKLGGFYTIHQLLQIYSFDSLVIAKIEPFCTIDTLEIKKINVNAATFKELQAHPLISYNLTKNIFDYKKIVGTIDTIDELLINNIIKPNEYKILKYYMKTF